MASATNRMLWWAMVASLVIYVGVAAYARPAGTASDPGILFPALLLMGAGVGIGSLIHRRIALVRPIQSGALDPDTPEGRERSFRAFVINLVLSESVGIYGLLLSFVSGVVWYSAGFSLVAIGLMVVHRPTAPDLSRARLPAERATDSTPIA